MIWETGETEGTRRHACLQNRHVAMIYAAGGADPAARAARQARPSHPKWHRWTRDWCAANDIEYHFKQWGEWTPGENVKATSGTVDTAIWFAGKWLFSCENLAREDTHIDDQPDVYRVGKRAAGRLLDGRLHDGMPEHRP